MKKKWFWIILISVFVIYFIQKSQRLVYLIPSLQNDYFLERIMRTKRMISQESTSKFEISWQFEVPLIQQYPNYPNGCETASLAMLLNFHGIEISLSELNINYLPKQNVYEKRKTRYGPNPALFYAGDPRSLQRGWGCFEPVLWKMIKKLKTEIKWNNLEVIRNELALPLQDFLIFREPILIWTTIDYEEVSELYLWINPTDGLTYTYPKNSHTILITGVDELYYYINDPLKKEKNLFKMSQNHF